MSDTFEHRVECVSCGKRLKYSSAQIGQRGRCPRCKNAVLLPDPSAQAAADAHSWPPGVRPKIVQAPQPDGPVA